MELEEQVLKLQRARRLSGVGLASRRRRPRPLPSPTSKEDSPGLTPVPDSGSDSGSDQEGGEQDAELLAEYECHQ